MEASTTVRLGIAGLALAVAGLFVVADRQAARRTGAAARLLGAPTAAVVAAWLAGFWLLGASGVLTRFDRVPPPMGLALVAVLAAAVALGRSRVGERFAQGLPLGWLVLAQAFRLPLELVMHQAAVEHVMPVEMSFAGYNFDIVTGALALPVGLLATRTASARALVLLWNLLGTLTLSVVLVVALLAMPMLHAFGTSPEHLNTWVTHAPFVWLPSVLVVAALFGHIVVFRALATAEVRSTALAQ